MVRRRRLAGRRGPVSRGTMTPCPGQSDRPRDRGPRMTGVEQPPPVVAALRRAVVELCAGRHDVAVEQGPVTDEPGSHGWRTALSPSGQGSGVWFWFDGFDEDLMLFVDDEYYAEWLDLTDVPAVVADVVGICAAVLDGRLWVSRDGRRRHLDLQAPDGRRWTLPGGRDSLLPWRRPARDGGLPGHGS